MAKSYIKYVSDGVNRQFDLTFPYMSKAHVVVLFNDASQPFEWINDTRVQTDAVPAAGTEVKVMRVTPTSALTVYQAASTLRGADLTRALRQCLYLAEENGDEAYESLQLSVHRERGDTAVDLSIPPVAERAGKLAAYDDAGLPTVTNTTLAEFNAAIENAIAASQMVGASLWSTPVLGVIAIPPVSPAIGDKYLIAHTGTSGVFVGNEDQVTQWNGEIWVFSGAPNHGQLISIEGSNDALYYSGTWQSVGGEVHVGMFGAKAGDSTFNSTPAFQDAVDFCLTNGIRKLNAPGNYWFGGTVDVSGFSYGFEINGGGAYTHASFPANTDWMTPQAIFRYGETGGSMVGQRNSWQYFDGSNKAALWANSSNHGCGGSFFHCGYARDFIQVFYEPGGTSPHSSNKITGHYWAGGAVGILAKGVPVAVEGLIVDVGFITSCKYGGFLGLDGANFVIFASGFGADFNGHWLSKIAVASLTGFAVGQTITCVATSQTARIISVGTYQGEKRLIVAETEDVSANNSNFASGQTITNGTNSTAISSAPITANHSGNNIYFDVINGMSPSWPFSRWKYNGSYLGGVWSNLLYTDVGSWTNSNSSITNVLNGLMVTNNGAGQMTLYNRYLSDSTPVLDTTPALVTFGARDIYMPGAGISSGNVGVTLTNGVASNLVTLPAAGANGAAWIVNVVNPGDANINGSAIVFIDSGGAAVLSTLSAVNLSFSLSGRTVRATQNTGADRFAVVNHLRMSLN